MRNSAYVFSWIFFIFSVMMLVALLLCWLIAGLTGQADAALTGTFCSMLIPMVLLGMAHHAASLKMLHHPALAGAIEFLPGILFIALTFLSGQPLYLALGAPHLLIGSLALLSADENLALEV